MNATYAAPRLSASMPTAPVPANTSRKCEPETPAPRTLKSVSRRRSLVGRNNDPLRDFSKRLRYVPAMTRMTSFSGNALTDARKMIALLPVLGQRVENRAQLKEASRFVREFESLSTRQFQ